MAVSPWGAAAAIAGAALGSGGRNIDWSKIDAYGRSMHPEGYVSPQDVNAAEGTRKRLTAGVGRTYEEQATGALRRSAARGLAGAPGTETTLKQLQTIEGQGKERAGEAADEQLYNAFLGNKRFEQSKDLALLSGRMGAEGQNRGYQALRDSSYYNSLLGLSQGVIDNWPGGTTSGGGGFNPDWSGDT